MESKNVIIKTKGGSSKETISEFLKDKKSFKIARICEYGNEEITEKEIETFVKENGNQGYIYIDMFYRFETYIKMYLIFMKYYNQVNFIFSYSGDYIKDEWEQYIIDCVNDYILKDEILKNKYELKHFNGKYTLLEEDEKFLMYNLKNIFENSNKENYSILEEYIDMREKRIIKEFKEKHFFIF